MKTHGFDEYFYKVSVLPFQYSINRGKKKKIFMKKRQDRQNSNEEIRPVVPSWEISFLLSEWNQRTATTLGSTYVAMLSAATCSPGLLPVVPTHKFFNGNFYCSSRDSNLECAFSSPQVYYSPRHSIYFFITQIVRSCWKCDPFWYLNYNFLG